jgi:DUF1009 family protein
MPRFERLGIVAGSGDLPLRIARRAREAGTIVHVMAIDGQADPGMFDGFPCEVIRLGAAGQAIAWARTAGLKDLVFAGAVRRPSLRELRPDVTASRVLGRSLLSFGDDGLLRRIILYLEETEGLRIHPISAILDDLTVAAGSLTTLDVPPDRDPDIRRGVAVLRALDSQDVGQGVCVQDGVVLGIEGAEGTDALIARCGILAKDGLRPILVKLSKRTQTDRADLPTIGPGTVHAARDAGFAGIVIEADRCLVVEREVAVAEAEAAGLFLVAIKDDVS